jgi:hypothetical protein
MAVASLKKKGGVTQFKIKRPENKLVGEGS